MCIRAGEKRFDRENTFTCSPLPPSHTHPGCPSSHLFLEEVLSLSELTHLLLMLIMLQPILAWLGKVVAKVTEDIVQFVCQVTPQHCLTLQQHPAGQHTHTYIHTYIHSTQSILDEMMHMRDDTKPHTEINLSLVC